ncbi:MAG: hypothetical protein LUC37_02000 [Prevotella sp.]|nr:hypothetical protein [Prevotella sp.]
MVKCSNETKQPRTIFNAYPDFFEWTVDQEYGSDYVQKLVLDRNGLWLNRVKLGAGGDVDLSNYYTKSEIDNMLKWYSVGDNWAQIAVGDDTYKAIIEVEQNFDDGNPSINLNAPYGTINCTAGSFLYNNCEVATQCWVQDYVASTSPGGESVYPTVSTSIPTSITLDGNKLYTGSISSNIEITFHTTDSVAGAEVQIIIQATSAATVSLTGSSAVFTDGYSSIDVASGKYLEINAIYDGSKIYVRSGYSE